MEDVVREPQPNLFDIEAKAFALWKVEATEAYKRHIMVELYNLIKVQQNQTDVRLFSDLKHTCYNVTRVEFECALAALQYFDIVGIHPVRTEVGEPCHVNLKRRKTQAWRKYTKQIQKNQPDAR